MMEKNVIKYYCESCDAGPWGETELGGDDKPVFELHIKQGHIVEFYNPVKHDSLKSGVRVGQSDFSGNVASEVDRALCDEEKLDKYCDEGVGEESIDFVVWDMVRLMITTQHMVSIIEINNVLVKWAKFFGIPLEHVQDVPSQVINDPEMFPIVRDICFQKGKRKEPVIFDRSQLTEATYWLMGRYHLKRIELTGDLLFFNDMYYEKNAEALIRREARKLFNKTKNSEITEVVRLVEDTCQTITWDAIEKSIHKKCMLNGTYDLLTGKFVESFSPDNIILSQIPHNYDRFANWHEIDRVVSSIISDDKDRQSFYDAISCALLPFTGIDFQFGGVGQPGTGKSQLCDLVEFTFGKDNVGGARIHDIAKDQTTQKDMAFKMINIDQDLSSESLEHIDVLKKWITQDSFTARSIYEHSTTFRPMARLMFMANELYEIPNPDDAEAIYERTHVIRIENKFRGGDAQINKIMKKTATEPQLCGFIAYLLRNCTEIVKNEKIHHPMNFGIVRDTWNTFGNRVKAFCEKWFVYGAGEKVEANDVWVKWVSYAQRHHYQMKDKKKFYPIIEEITGSASSKTRIDDVQVYAFHGFRLKTDYEMEKEETLPLNESELKEKGEKVILSILQSVVRRFENKL